MERGSGVRRETYLKINFPKMGRGGTINRCIFPSLAALGHDCPEVVEFEIRKRRIVQKLDRGEEEGKGRRGGREEEEGS
jgi:hypothetical protein